MYEYLQLKVKQAEDISKRDTKGKSDKELQRNLQYLLSQVKKLEQFSKDLCQQLSERDDESLRKDYLSTLGKIRNTMQNVSIQRLDHNSAQARNCKNTKDS
ncbi:hypothetical protein Hanom_Chr03g00196481 [Helianthus anomalus]